MMFRSINRFLSGAMCAAILFALAAPVTPPAHAQNAHQPTARNIAHGKEVYRRANCMGCHKWHGAGGGGYGGLALSLRATSLDRQGLLEVIRCGRAGTNMPLHDLKAWDEGRCYGGAKRTDVDASVFPPSGIGLSEREMQSVTDYVIAVLLGTGEPTQAECLEFWGKDAVRTCRPYKTDD
jgi:hypothetical protein